MLKVFLRRLSLTVNFLVFDFVLRSGLGVVGWCDGAG